MKKNLIADYFSCFIFKTASFFTGFLPLTWSLFLGRRLGDLIFVFDLRHRAIAAANIKKSGVTNNSPQAIFRLTRRTYQAFGQNLVEISFLPRVNKQYLEKYVQFENKHYAAEAFTRGKGVIFLIVHEGNWELSNIICANLGIPFVLFVRDQGFPRLNALLNTYRLKQGAKIIHKQAGVRQLIEVLKNNQSIGMTTDQGGKKGERVEFFGKAASMSTGAIRLALKYDCAIIPIYYTRLGGPYTKVILDQIFTATKGVVAHDDLKDNLQRLIQVYEKYIQQYPQEYLWSYKIWKYSGRKDILILSDGKTGHLRQAQGVAKLLERNLAARGMCSCLQIQEVKFRSNFAGRVLNLVTFFSGKYPSWRLLEYLHWVLTKETWEVLARTKPDIIISAGTKLSAVNYLLARQNQARALVLMRPGILGTKRFDLVIIPRHDRPGKRKNLVITSGALNLIGVDYLKEKSALLLASGLIKNNLAPLRIGVLIGGSSREFFIDPPLIKQVIDQIKIAALGLAADILLTTSRRTTKETEQAIKQQLENYAPVKLLILAGENNHPDVLGGILGLSNIIIVSGESISMISEAVASGKYVIVFSSPGLSRKHERFLKVYAERKYIYLSSVGELAFLIQKVWQDQPKINLSEDNAVVAQALESLI